MNQTKIVINGITIEAENADIVIEGNRVIVKGKTIVQQGYSNPYWYPWYPNYYSDGTVSGGLSGVASTATPNQGFTVTATPHTPNQGFTAGPDSAFTVTATPHDSVTNLLEILSSN